MVWVMILSLTVQAHCPCIRLVYHLHREVAWDPLAVIQHVQVFSAVGMVFTKNLHGS